MEAADSWVDVIHQASERVRTLTAPQPRLGPAPPTVGVTDRRSEMQPALELMQQERFVQALEAIDRLPSHWELDRDRLLLRAVLLTHGGRLEEAEAVCRTLLQLDELNAGAHYVVALCREGVGDWEGAAEQDRMASYLDRSFAMPRLHLGLLARKRDHRTEARHELAQAIALLQREEPARVLFFGGGFGREALIALCEAELRSCGGHS